MLRLIFQGDLDYLAILEIICALLLSLYLYVYIIDICYAEPFSTFSYSGYIQSNSARCGEDGTRSCP